MGQLCDHHRLSNLTPAEAWLGGAAARAKVIATVCVGILVLLGWLYLGLTTAAMLEGPAGAIGTETGPADLGAWPDWYGRLGRSVVVTLCRPSFGGSSSADMSLLGDATFSLAMWCAMVLATMLPAAGPMILTYSEIADTAARKGEKAVSPLVLIGGYVAIWLGFAAVAMVLQLALMRAALLDPALATVDPLLSGSILVGAGLYQLTALKEACLTRCQRPFPFFFANWSVKPREIFRIGLAQGLYCVGCCWAAMLVMFAVGAMNILWMAVLGFVLSAEKIATTMTLSRAVGWVFVAVGAAVIVAAIIA